MYMLDTNACIQAIRGAKSDKYAYVTATFKAKLPQGVALSTIALSELEYGVMHSAYPDKNAVALAKFLIPIEILPFDTAAALISGEIREELQRQNQMIGPYDLLIAAHAKSLNYTLVTNNTREFCRVKGLTVEDWFAELHL